MPLVNPKVELQICSHQKDQHYSDILKSHLSTCLSSIFGEAATLRWMKYINLSGDFLYHAITTLSGLQTLGEEYVNIIQVDSSERKLPSFVQRLLTVILRTVFLPLIAIISNRIKNNQECIRALKRPTSPTDACTKIIAENLDFFTENIQQLNLALFYLMQRYHTISKRLTRVKYVRFAPASPHGAGGVDDTFDVIGRLMALRSIFTLVTKISAFISQAQKETDELRPLNESSSSAAYSCHICLNDFDTVSVAKCGHTYCWDCIHSWLVSKPECPFCREPLTPRDVVSLRNF